MPIVSVCLPPKEAYFKIVEKGEQAANAPTIKVFHQAFVGGCYIGFGGLLSMVIGGQLPNADPGTQTFVFAALFPVNLLLILLTGGSLFTGNTAAMPAAVFEGKTNWLQALRCLATSWVGNFLSCIIFALLTEYAELCPTDYDSGTGCGLLAAKVVQKKVASTFRQTFVKGIMCNWMVCMAVFLSCQAQDMTGKMVGIWFPISAFVCMGMEHSVANMFMLPLGFITGQNVLAQGGTFDVGAGTIMVANMIPVSLGNFFAGAVCVAASYSYAFGKLGESSTNCGTADMCKCILGTGCSPKTIEQKAIEEKSGNVSSTPSTPTAVAERVC
jgi:formate/nitrite transporter